LAASISSAGGWDPGAVVAHMPAKRILSSLKISIEKLWAIFGGGNYSAG
jgi:hypothetical protein